MHDERMMPELMKDGRDLLRDLDEVVLFPTLVLHGELDVNASARAVREQHAALRLGHQHFGMERFGLDQDLASDNFCRFRKSRTER